jgi:hypothetical protein
MKFGFAAIAERRSSVISYSFWNKCKLQRRTYGKVSTDLWRRGGLMEEITENIVLNIGMESGDDEYEDDISTCFPYNRS